MGRPHGSRGRATQSRTWTARPYPRAACELLAAPPAIASLRRNIRPRHRSPLHGTLQRTNAYPFRTRARLRGTTRSRAPPRRSRKLQARKTRHAPPALPRTPALRVLSQFVRRTGLFLRRETARKSEL